LKAVLAIGFRSDLELGYATLINYFRLRFQNRLNLTGAIQFWGLKGFMAIKAMPVYNSINHGDADD
jgi:hypothetical protein